MSEILDLSAAAGGERRARPASSTPASCSSSTGSGRPPEALNAFPLGCAARRRNPLPRRLRAAPLGGVPLGVKDLFCTEGIPSQAGSRRSFEGYRPPYTATVVARLDGGGRAAAGQDQPGRVRDGLLQ